MIKKYLVKGAAALVTGFAVAACSHDFSASESMERASIDNAQEALGFYIPENQDWVMSSLVSANIPIEGNEGETYTVKIYSNDPKADGIGYVLAKADVQSGQNFVSEFRYPSNLTSFVVGLTNSRGWTVYKSAQIENGQITSLGASAASTRAAIATVSNPTVDTEGFYSLNARLAHACTSYFNRAYTQKDEWGYQLTYANWVLNQSESYKNSGWDDKYYQVTATVALSTFTEEEAEAIDAAIQNVIGEGQYNLNKAIESAISITTEGGPVTLTPVHASSNSNDRISYYYYKEGEKPQLSEIKKMKKYTLGEIGSERYKTFSLVYVDENGNASYDFPEGYVINLIVSNTSQKDETLQLGRMIQYAVQPDETHNAGDKVILGDDLLELTFGLAGGADFAAGKKAYGSASEGLLGYEAYTAGNGKNGKQNKDGSMQNGTFYNIKPSYDGVVSVGVVVAATKTLKILEDGAVLKDSTVTDKFYGTTEFPVKAGSTYTIYADGSKLGFYGLEYFEDNKKSDIPYYTQNMIPDYYADGLLNQEIHNWDVWNGTWACKTDPTRSHNALFTDGTINYLGFEDWNDFDYNDIVFAITGTKVEDDTPVIEVEQPKESKQIWSYAFEDSNRKSDYDMNDVVIKVQESLDGTQVTFKLVAAGCEYSNEVYFNNTVITWNNGSTEVHDALGVPKGTLTNTKARTGVDGIKPATATYPSSAFPKTASGNIDFQTADIKIKPSGGDVATGQDGGDGFVHIAETGKQPTGIVIPCDWKWPTERTSVVNAYNKTIDGVSHSFASWASQADIDLRTAVADWYEYPTGSVME